jgi:C4-type Zn-finger protein
MKKSLAAVFAAVALLGTSAASAYSQSCAVKINALQAQLEAARQAGNINKVAGLQRALQQTKTKCTDEAQYTRAERKARNAQKDVNKAQKELDRAKQQLHDARASGDAEEISKGQYKVAEKEHALREKMDDLRAAHANLGAIKG